MNGDSHVALTVFTRDLCVADDPALTAASRGSKMACAFVHDEALRSGRAMDRRRTSFLSANSCPHAKKTDVKRRCRSRSERARGYLTVHDDVSQPCHGSVLLIRPVQTAAANGTRREDRGGVPSGAQWRPTPTRASRTSSDASSAGGRRARLLERGSVQSTSTPDRSGGETLEPVAVDETVTRIRAAIGVPIGVSTRAWIEANPFRCPTVGSPRPTSSGCRRSACRRAPALKTAGPAPSATVVAGDADSGRTVELAPPAGCPSRRPVGRSLLLVLGGCPETEVARRRARARWGSASSGQSWSAASRPGPRRATGTSRAGGEGY